MPSGSEFRVFVSSTCYDLNDLRSELAQFLQNQFIKPILSNDQGFPDHPELKPYESCLPELDSCPVVIAVLDGRYGQLFDWPNFAAKHDEFKGRSLSPTHAEILYARLRKKRLLIFVRRELWNGYDYFRAWLKAQGDDVEAACKTFVRPKFVDVEALKLLYELKQWSPVPWLEPFDTVVDLKTIVLQRLMNELADLLHARAGQIASLLNVFGNIMDQMDDVGRKEMQASIAKLTRSDELLKKLQDQVEVKQAAAEQAQRKVEKLSNDLLHKSKEGDRAQAAVERLKVELESARAELKQERAEVKKGKAATIEASLASIAQSPPMRPNAYYQNWEGAGALYGSVYPGVGTTVHVQPGVIYFSDTCSCGRVWEKGDQKLVDNMCPMCSRHFCRNCIDEQMPERGKVCKDCKTGGKVFTESGNPPGS